MILRLSVGHIGVLFLFCFVLYFIFFIPCSSSKFLVINK